MQLGLAAFGPVAGLNQNLCLILRKPVLQLFIAGHCLARLAAQRDQFDHAPGQLGLDIIGKCRRHDDRLFGRAREQSLCRSLEDGIAVGRHIHAPTGQARQKIRHHLHIGSQAEAHKTRLRLNFTRDDTFAFRVVPVPVLAATCHGCVPEAVSQAPASSSSSSASVSASSST